MGLGELRPSPDLEGWPGGDMPSGGCGRGAARPAEAGWAGLAAGATAEWFGRAGPVGGRHGRGRRRRHVGMTSEEEKAGICRIRDRSHQSERPTAILICPLFSSKQHTQVVDFINLMSRLLVGCNCMVKVRTEQVQAHNYTSLW